MSLSRYRSIVPEWESFLAAVATPEPVTFRVRPRLLPEERVIARLERQGFALAPIRGLSGYWRVMDGPDSVAQTPEHWSGLLHVQQAVMALPSLALAPRPGEAILDLCAAPGGKTTHIAELMADRGPLVAVDPKEKRLRGLLGNLYRLGHPNVIVVAADGRALPTSATFDRVLVDAPCSAEGNLRRQAGRGAGRDAGFVDYVTSVQEALLRRAIELTRPGGVLVYSTCTFAPEENEAVVTRVLADSPIAVEPIQLEAPHSPGLSGWDGELFDPSLREAWRIYPHQMDSGGLFMVRLRKLGAGTSAVVGWTPPPPVFPGGDEEDGSVRLRSAQDELVHRFGLGHREVEEMGWMVRGENIWAHTAERWPFPAWSAQSPGGRWRVVSMGIRSLRERPPGRETPSSHFLARWGRHMAPDRQVHLDPTSLGRLLRNERLPAEGRSAGPVALLWEDLVLGRGMIGTGGLRHEIPKASAERLLTVLERLGSRMPD